jgi:hypothetical protein
MKISDAIKLRIDLRDQKSALKAQEAEIQEKIDKIDLKLLEVFNKTGTESIKTEHGTAYASSRTTASVADKDVFLNFVKSNNEWSLMEVRASSTAVREYNQNNDGVVVPGVNISVERTVNIRRT